MATALPALGATYGSIDDFKRAVYRACLDLQCQANTRESKVDTFCRLGCPLKDGSDAKGRCSFSCNVHLITNSSPPSFRVISSNAAHSCSETERLQKREAAKHFCEARLKALDQPRPPSTNAPSPPPVAGPSRTRTPSPLPREEEEEEDDSVRRSGRKRQGVRPVDELEVPQSKRKKRRTTFRRGKGKVDEKGKGKKTADLEGQEELVDAFGFPHSFSQFSSAHALILRLHAFATDSDFLFSRLVFSPDKKSFVLVGVLKEDVQKSSKRRKDVLIEVFAGEGGLGKWGIRSWTTRQVRVAKRRPPTETPIIESAPITLDPSLPSATRLAPPSTPLSVVAPVPAPPPPDIKPLLSSSVASPRRTSRLSRPSKRSEPLQPALEPFLAATLPSPPFSASDFALLQRFFRSSGLDTVEDFVTLLSFEESSVEGMVQTAVERDEATAEEGDKVDQLLAEIRELFLQEKDG